MNHVSNATLDEMQAYYRARAAEYDEWWLRRGRYDRGPELNARWFAEVQQLYQALDTLAPAGDLLELAPGTGTWTARLLRTARSLTAVDAAPEMLALNQARVGDGRVRYLVADLFTWVPDQLYDGVCCGFWLSHVPLERLDAFLHLVASALRPGGMFFFADSRREPESQALDHQLPPSDAQLMTRRLNDGRSFTIVKNFHAPEELAARCTAAGLAVEVRETPTFFIYGVGIRAGRG